MNELRASVWSALRLPDSARDAWDEDQRSPAAENCGGHLWIRVLTAGGAPGGGLEAQALDIVAGNNVVVTRHVGPIGFLEQLLDEPDTGRHLERRKLRRIIPRPAASTYFEAVSSFKSEVEQLVRSRSWAGVRVAAWPSCAQALAPLAVNVALRSRSSCDGPQDRRGRFAVG